MKSKAKYAKAPKEIARAISESEPIEDFLPRPDKLVFKEEAVKVTLSLGKKAFPSSKKWLKRTTSRIKT